MPAIGSPTVSSGRGGQAVGTEPSHSLAQPHGEHIDFPLSLSSFFFFFSLILLKELDLECSVVFL